MFGLTKKKNLRELKKVFNELANHIWENGGFKDEKGSYGESTAYNLHKTNPAIRKAWRKYHELCARANNL